MDLLRDVIVNVLCMYVYELIVPNMLSLDILIFQKKSLGNLVT